MWPWRHNNTLTVWAVGPDRKEKVYDMEKWFKDPMKYALGLLIPGKGASLVVTSCCISRYYVPTNEVITHSSQSCLFKDVMQFNGTFKCAPCHDICWIVAENVYKATCSCFTVKISSDTYFYFISLFHRGNACWSAKKKNSKWDRVSLESYF